MAEKDTPQDGDGDPVSSARLPVWRLGWMAGAFGLGAVAVAGAVALTYIWMTRPMPDEAPLRAANLAVVDHLADNLVSRFSTPAAALRRLADRFAENDLGPDDTFAVTEALNATLAVAPDLQSLSYVDQNLRVVAAERDANGAIGFALRDLADDGEALRQLGEAQAGGPGSSHWGPLVYSGGEGDLLSTLSVPVFRDGSPLGMLHSQVRLRETVYGAVATGDSTPFILMGADYVQFHPELAPPQGGKARTATLVSELGDPIVSAVAALVGAGKEVPGRLATGDGAHMVSLRELPGPGGAPWYVGAYRTVPERTGFAALTPLAGLFAAIALMMLVIGLRIGGRIDHTLNRQAGAIGSAAALKLGPRPRLPRSRVRGLEAVNHAIARLGQKLEEFPDLAVATGGGKPAASTGQAPRPRTGEALVVWVQASLPGSDGTPLPAASAAAAINGEIGLMADRIELEGGIALPDGCAVAGVWFLASEDTPSPDGETPTDSPSDIRRLVEELVTISNTQTGADGTPRPVFSAGVARGEAVLAEFGPPRRRRFGIAGPAADQARAGALTAARAPGMPVAFGDGIGNSEPQVRRTDDLPAGRVRLSREAGPTNR